MELKAVLIGLQPVDGIYQSIYSLLSKLKGSDILSLLILFNKHLFLCVILMWIFHGVLFGCLDIFWLKRQNMQETVVTTQQRSFSSISIFLFHLCIPHSSLTQSALEEWLYLSAICWHKSRG